MSVARVVRGPFLPRLAAGVCALALALALAAGCTSNAEPSPLPEPSTSTSPSASPSATPPPMPPEAEGTSSKAAKAFARHYFDVINYAARSGDTDGLRELGTKDCVSCEAIASNIEKIYNSGGHIESDGWRLEQVRNLQTTSRQSVLSLGVFLEPEVVVDRDGQREPHQGRQQPMTMRLLGNAGEFRVNRLDLVS